MWPKNDDMAGNWQQDQVLQNLLLQWILMSKTLNNVSVYLFIS